MVQSPVPVAESVPAPDPTRLTTEQLFRELAALKESMLREIGCSREIIDTRLDAMDKATDLRIANTSLAAVAAVTDVRHLDEVMNIKFAGVQTEFILRDERVKQTASDTKTAVDAAVITAREALRSQTETFTSATEKSDANTAKQIDQQRQLHETATKAINDKVDDTKDRLIRMEGRGSGYANAWGFAVGAIGVVIAVIAFLR